MLLQWRRGRDPPAPDTPSLAPALEIDDLHVSVDDREILRGVSLAGRARRRSTPSWARTARASRPSPTRCSPTPRTRSPAGRILLAGEDITALPTDERAAPRPVPRLPAPRGDPRASRCSTSCARRSPSARASTTSPSSRCACSLIEWTKRLGMDTRFQERYLNEGFSGGEKKRNEVLQMAMMEPDVAVLDETDSGLDIDALRQVAAGIAEVRKERPQLGILAITHYQRLLEHLVPDVVHVLVDGRIVATGGPEISPEVEARGFDAFRAARGRGRSRERARRRRDQARLPAPRTRGQRQARRLPRLRVVGAEAASPCSTRWTTATATTTPTSTAACTRSPRRRPPRSRPRAARSPASSTRRRTAEIVFTRNATESINLVAYTWARANLQAGDAIVLSHMEHHANVVPVADARRRTRRRAALDPADRRLPPRPHRTSTRCSTAPACSRSARCRTCSARSTTSARSPTPRTRTARSCSSTRASTCRTSPPTCRPGTPTSSRSRRTRSSARAASARCGRATSCSTRCRRSSAAAR